MYLDNTELQYNTRYGIARYDSLTIIDFFSWHTASLNVERSMPVTFSMEGHLESSIYMDKPVPHPRSVAALGFALIALYSRQGVV
jgi:hypothetical protein